jgi:hypothetical protein
MNSRQRKHLTIFDNAPLQFDCTECFDGLDDIKDCLRECNNDGLLDGCLERTDDKYKDESDQNLKKIDSLEDFSECCDFDGSCEKDLESAEDCVTSCIDPCIREAPKEYIDCINDEVRDDPASTKCGRQACINGFLDEDGLEDELGGSGLDLKNLQDKISKINAEDLEDCSLLEDFVNEVCEVGEDCCEKCNKELGAVVDCLINDVVVPMLAIQLNTTVATCPIDTDKCELKVRRELSQEQVGQFNRLVSSAKKTPPQSKRDLIKDASYRRVLQDGPKNVDDCEGEIQKGMLLTNVTDGANKYMECVIGAATDVMVAVEEEDETSGSSTVVTMAAFVATFLSTLVF